MKYQIKIVQSNGGYIGYALLDNKAVYTSSLQSNPASASSEVVRYIKANGRVVPENKITPNTEIDRSSIVPNRNVAPSPSRCCGRG